MPLTLTEATLKAARLAQIKATLEAYNLSVSAAAVALGMHRTRLSHTLNSNPHLRKWWAKRKEEKKKANARARAARWRAKRARADAEANGWTG